MTAQLPIVTTELKVSDGRIQQLAFAQRDPIPGRGLTWNQRIDVVVANADGAKHLPVQLNTPRAEVVAARGVLSCTGRCLAPSALESPTASFIWIRRLCPG